MHSRSELDPRDRGRLVRFHMTMGTFPVPEGEWHKVESFRVFEENIEGLVGLGNGHCGNGWFEDTGFVGCNLSKRLKKMQLVYKAYTAKKSI